MASHGTLTTARVPAGRTSTDCGPTGRVTNFIVAGLMTIAAAYSRVLPGRVGAGVRRTR